MSLSSGVKITADVDDLTRKLDYAMGRIDREVTNLQKKAGVHATVCGDLVNRYGQLVEGLNLTQIKLGQYVDEMGTVHTANGEFVADLNKVEQALGFYADELGNVYNRQGKYIRQTADARKAVEEKIKAENEAFEAGQRSAVVFSSALSGISNTFGQLANTFATLNTSGDLSSFGNNLLRISQTISTITGTYQGTNGLIKGIKDAVQSSKNLFSGLGKMSSEAGNNIKGLRGAVTKLGPAFAALGGPVGIAVAGVAAIGAGIMAYKASNNVNDKISDSFKELEKRARAAGDSIKGVGDALKYGAFAESMSEFEKASQGLAKAEANLKEAKQKAKEAMEAASEAAKFAGLSPINGAVDYGKKTIAAAQAEQKNAWAEYNGVVAKMIDAAREEQKTEVDRLEEQLKAFRDIEEYAQETEALTVVQKQIGIFEEKIKEAKAREAEQAGRPNCDPRHEAFRKR